MTTASKWLAPIVVLVFVLGMAAPALADDRVTVQAEVQPADYGIVLDSGSNLNYGTPQLNTSYVNEMYGTPITVRNVGTVPCQLTVLGTDATNGMGGYWNLYDYPGMNQFVWNINGNMYNVNIKDSMWGAQTIANNLYPGSSAQYSTYLDMPNSSSSYGTYSFSADIYATSP